MYKHCYIQLEYKLHRVTHSTQMASNYRTTTYIVHSASVKIIIINRPAYPPFLSIKQEPDIILFVLYGIRKLFFLFRKLYIQIFFIFYQVYMYHYFYLSLKNNKNYIVLSRVNICHKVKAADLQNILENQQLQIFQNISSNIHVYNNCQKSK